MKILIVTDGYPTDNYPLNGIFTYDQAKALQALGHEVTVASIDLRSIRRWRRWGKYHFIRDNITIYNYSFPVGAFPLKTLCFWGKKCLSSLFKNILKEQGAPDIIHAHFTFGGNISTILKQKYNIPLVITEHSSTVNKEVIPKSIFNLAKEAYFNADKLISVSSKLAESIFRHWNIKPLVVHNVVDIDIFTTSSNKNKSNFNFLSVGILNYNKGFDILIKGFHKANFKNSVNLLIIGDGDIKKELQAMINDYGLSNQVKLLGRLSRKEIAEIAKKCQAFVLASRSETFGVVYIEAMAAGLPVIATACGGPEDFVNDKNGILIPPNNVDELKGALLQMYNTYDTYNGAEISEECIRKFSPHSIATQLTDIYEDLLKNYNL